MGNRLNPTPRPQRPASHSEKPWISSTVENTSLEGHTISALPSALEAKLKVGFPIEPTDVRITIVVRSTCGTKSASSLVARNASKAPSNDSATPRHVASLGVTITNSEPKITDRRLAVGPSINVGYLGTSAAAGWSCHISKKRCNSSLLLSGKKYCSAPMRFSWPRANRSAQLAFVSPTVSCHPA